MSAFKEAFDTAVLWGCGLGLGGIALAALALGLSRCPARVRAAARWLGGPTVFVLGGFMAFATLEGAVTRAYKERCAESAGVFLDRIDKIDRITETDTPNASNPVNPVNPVKDSPRLPASNNSAFSDSNLCFCGIERGTDAVTLGVAWPDGLSLPDGRLDVFGNWRLTPDGWTRLAHAGTTPGVETDYDYTLTQAGDLPPNVVLVDGDSLFGVDDTSTAFAGEGKVASVYVLKFDFITPAGDPVESAQPGNGIGQNEFTYDDGTSTLSVLLQVEVQPTIPESLGLAGTFTLPAMQGATLTWSEDSPAGSATARTDEGFDEAEHTILSARATYHGYPTRNSGFGRKTATFACCGVTISQDFEVFFPKSGKNHPTCTTCPNCPNWFYYWRDGAVCGISQSCLYDDTAVYGYTLPGVDRLIRLGPRAAMVNSGPEPYESSLDGFGSVVVTGSGKGIQCVAETIQHEAHHLDTYDRFHGQGEDPDGDGIPTTEEGILDGMATHPNNPNTYNLDEVYQKYGDDEVRCRKIEQSLSIPMYPASDWANPGCQHKNQYGPKVQW